MSIGADTISDELVKERAADLGPVSAFCETAMKCTFIDFFIEAASASMGRSATLLRSEVEAQKIASFSLTP